MDTSNATEGHLVIFDRDETKIWDKKIFSKIEKIDGKKIFVWGM
jgi:hypothetical protein